MARPRQKTGTNAAAKGLFSSRAAAILRAKTMTDPIQPSRRRLSNEERKLLEWLLDHGSSAPEPSYRSQLADLWVSSTCNCGCPTINLTFGDRDRPTGAPTILADAVGVTPEGIDVGVILFACDGALSMLEVYSYGHVEPFSLPRLETLKAFVTNRPRVN